MNIVMIGPVYPYKGGISHYTGMMCRALRKKHDTHMVSYKMQYPRLLFRKEQRDYTNECFKVEDTKYWLNTANPFNIIWSASKIRKLKPDLVILQWWHPYFAPCYFLLRKCLGRCRKLMVCHNVFPHERFPLDKFLTGLSLRGMDYYLVQSRRDEEDLLALKPSAAYSRVFHPTYNAFKMKNMTREEARRQLSIGGEEKVMLFFGYVRPYKGLRHILRALPAVREKVPDIRLLVVGDFGDDRQEYMDLIREKKIAPYVKIVEGYIPDQEVEQYFAAADLAVLPYESATQSGIAQIAYGFDMPIVATDVGGLPEVVLDGKTGYVVPQGDDTALGEAVVRFFTDTDIERMQQNIRQEEYKYSWDRMREEIEKLVGCNE
ncbi:MAG: glycosyltransferase family 4 protein [Lachnospiraceae bacterium]|nr:glycosyltransferase family 4 protein [Lachnospiraceae bacterium]